jgi:hypothetical protein
MDFGGKSPPRTAQSLGGLPTVFFSRPRRMLMRTDNGAINKQVFGNLQFISV